jgi:hypothetical protein
MPYAQRIENDCVVLDTSASDNYIPHILKEAVDLLALIRSGAEENAEGIRVGMPQMIRDLRLYKVVSRDDLTGLKASISINGVTVVFDGEADSEKVWADFQKAMSEKSIAYRNSPEGIKQELDRAENVRVCQHTVNEQLHELELIATSVFPAQKDQTGAHQPKGEVAIRLFNCLVKLVDSGDIRGVEYDRMHIVNLLRLCGYVQSEFTGNNPPFDLASWRAYVAGQIISCLMPGSMNLLPPLASYKITKHGLNTAEFIPEQAFRGSYGKG